MEEVEGEGWASCPSDGASIWDSPDFTASSGASHTRSLSRKSAGLSVCRSKTT